MGCNVPIYIIDSNAHAKFAREGQVSEQLSVS